MSGAMRKIGEYLGLLEEVDRYDDELDEAPKVHDAEERPVRRPKASGSKADLAKAEAPMGAESARPSQERPTAVADLAERRRSQAATTGPTGVVAELSRIITLHPSTYNEARTVGENYRDGTPVIMNLTEMDDGDAKRLVDFAAGLIFATRGTIERVTNKVFLLSPPNVSVTAEDKARIASDGFFNQS